MPKTKDAFALREVHESMLNSFKTSFSADKAIGKWIGGKWLGVDIGEFDNEWRLHRFQALEHDFPRLQKKSFSVERHILRLQNYLERIVDRLISSDDDAVRARAARVRTLQSCYELILKELFNYETGAETLIESDRMHIPAEFKKIFGSRLRQARKQKGFTVDDVAIMLNLSYNGYSQYERGIREPPLWTLHQIAVILDVSADWLLGIEK